MCPLVTVFPVPPSRRARSMSPVASAILILATVAVIGLLIGSIKIRGIGLGAAGVLFAGIILGHFGAEIEPEIAHFAKEFGLVLFVFSIGLQLGPGILQLWKKQGLVLNTMAASVVVQGTLMVLAAGYWMDWSVTATAGLFSGATTNTPSLGAAQQAFEGMAVAAIGDAAVGDAAVGDAQMLASAYAVAYPGGIVGIIGVILVLRRIFAVQVQDEADKIAAQDAATREPVEHRCVVVENGRLAETPFGQLPGVEEMGVRISRIKRRGGGGVDVATERVTLAEGDLVQVVGTSSGLARFTPMIGRVCDEDLTVQPGVAQVRRVVVTEPSVINQPLHRLSLDQIYNTTVTRIRRSGVEMPARGSSTFSYGDVVTIVGEPESLDLVTAKLGNSVKALNETHFAPVFLGIAVGVLLGIVPLQIPGVPFPVKLGLAGGPLIAAIVFSLVGRLGRFVWYIPYSANLAIREMGIILFLASAGVGAGQTFFSVALTAQGAMWMLIGFLVTTVPLMTTAIVARYAFDVNYLTICGVVAGSMTDPPALAFANSMNESSACSTAYAAVYPLTMVLRIIAAQTIVYLMV